jgi:hypothetical protein
MQLQVCPQDIEQTSIQRLADESEKLQIPQYHTDPEQRTGQDLAAWETDSRIEARPHAMMRSRPISPLIDKPITIRRRRMSARKQASPSCDTRELERNGSQRGLTALKSDVKTQREGKNQLSLTSSALKPPLPRQTDFPKHPSEDFAGPSHLQKLSGPRFFKANILTESSPSFFSKPSGQCDHSLLDIHKMREFLTASTEGVRSCGQSPQGEGKKLMARKRLYS